MTINDIPVRVVGPGSQASSSEESLAYIDMPSDMRKYVAPVMPDPDTVSELDGARETVRWLRNALADYEVGKRPLLADLAALDDASRELLNQVLGEGEVSITYAGDVQAKTQEAVLAGVWRTFYLDDEGRVLYDLLEVADVPHLVRPPDAASAPVAIDADSAPPDVPNALPLLVEIDSHSEDYARTGTPHSINLSLLPLSEPELEYLDARLGRGPVDVLSRAYGKCQVISTRAPNVWWVRYYNSMGTPILNSIEITDVPQVVHAAAEDLRDSAARLEQIVAPYWSEVA